jgi:single-stranded DNA-binding protein
MRNSATIELIGYVYQDAKHPNENDYPNWVVFKMCVNKKYKTKSGEEKQDTSWYECKTSSEGIAKICKQYVKDKMGVLVKGIPKAKAYTSSSGGTEASIEVLITEINILTSPREKDTAEYSTNDNGRHKINTKSVAPEHSIQDDDEIPF